MAHPSQTKPPTAIEREIPQNRPSPDENRLVAFYEDNGRTSVLPNKTMVWRFLSTIRAQLVLILLRSIPRLYAFKTSCTSAIRSSPSGSLSM